MLLESRTRAFFSHPWQVTDEMFLIAATTTNAAATVKTEVYPFVVASDAP